MGDIRLPHDSGTNHIEAPWLSGPCVLVSQATSADDLKTAALGYGLYSIYADGPAWINAGPIDAVSADPEITSAAAAKPHPGGWFPCAVAEGQAIAIRSASAVAVNVRIFNMGQDD